MFDVRDSVPGQPPECPNHDHGPTGPSHSTTVDPSAPDVMVSTTESTTTAVRLDRYRLKTISTIGEMMYQG